MSSLTRFYRFLASQLCQPAWKFAALLSTICILIAMGGDNARSALRYESTFLENGHYYRAVTGHLTHLGFPHLGLNLLGLSGVWAIYADCFSARIWTFITLLCSVGISLGLYALNPNITHMAGLSGTLHGLLAAAITFKLLHWKKKKNATREPLPIEDVIMLIGLWTKIAYEHYVGSVPLTETLSEGSVITDAHIYGALIGTCLGALLSRCKINY